MSDASVSVSQSRIWVLSGFNRPGPDLKFNRFPAFVCKANTEEEAREYFVKTILSNPTDQNSKVIPGHLSYNTYCMDNVEKTYKYGIESYPHVNEDSYTLYQTLEDFVRHAELKSYEEKGAVVAFGYEEYDW